LAIIDEGHHGTAKSWRAFRDYFRMNENCKVLYLTATPKRGDGVALSKVCDSVAYSYSLLDAIEDGWLVPVRSQVVTVTDLNFAGIETVQGDFNRAQLEREMTQKVGHLHAIAVPTIEQAGDEQGIVYCAGLQHAQALADVMNTYKPGCAIHLNGKTEIEERRKWVGRFLDGYVQFLCVYGLFLEGFNAPKASHIIMARPTKNPSLYEQMLGRGTRTYPGTLDGLEDVTPEERRAHIAVSPKPHMTVLDFAGNSGKHTICRATDLLGGKYSERVRDYANKLLTKTDGPKAVKDLFAQAAAELALIEEEEARLRELKARAQYRLRDTDPFGNAMGLPGQSLAKPKLPATEKQVARLVSLGVSREFAQACDRKKAMAIIHQKLYGKSRRRA
jgi:superfamily II DNA or RNA helicase